MKIEVTQRHIDYGVPNLAQACPVAKALKEACPKYGWSVYGKDGWVWPEQTVAYIPDQTVYFPPEVHEFVTKFDKHEPVEPFSFEFELPEGVDCE